VPNRLSNSSINKFLQCSEAWRLHYRERLRTTEVSSALVFGSALGKAFEYALNPSCTDLPNIASTKEFFDYHWRTQEVNGVLTNLQECAELVYSKYDLDPELGDTPWDSLRSKAHLMIDTFERKLKPLITKVWSTEEKIELSNEEGDSSIGFADAVVSIEGYATPIVLDFKSAARPYELDSVVSSVQLAQYLHVLGPKYGTRLAGYAVFIKNIRKNRKKICSSCGHDGSDERYKTCNIDQEGKRCNGGWIEETFPEADMQLIIDTIPEQFENFVIDNIENVNKAIKAEIFVKNVNSCKDAGFGRPCVYYSLCHKNSTEGLVKLEESKE
jgi:hypothetical protein